MADQRRTHFAHLGHVGDEAEEAKRKTEDPVFTRAQIEWLRGQIKNPETRGYHVASLDGLIHQGIAEAYFTGQQNIVACAAAREEGKV